MVIQVLSVCLTFILVPYGLFRVIEKQIRNDGRDIGQPTIQWQITRAENTLRIKAFHSISKFI